MKVVLVVGREIIIFLDRLKITETTCLCSTSFSHWCSHISLSVKTSLSQSNLQNEYEFNLSKLIYLIFWDYNSPIHEVPYVIVTGYWEWFRLRTLWSSWSCATMYILSDKKSVTFKFERQDETRIKTNIVELRNFHWFKKDSNQLFQTCLAAYLKLTRKNAFLKQVEHTQKDLIKK